MENRKNRKFDYLSFIAVFFVIIGLIVIFYFMFNLPFNDKSNIRNAELFGQYGDFVGGFIGSLFALAGFFLIYKTLLTQQNAIRQQDSTIVQQRKMFEIQKFENTFFNLLKTQRDIADNIKSYFNSMNDITKISFETVLGRDFFIYSKVELLSIWQSLNSEKYLGIYDIDDVKYAKMKIDDLHSQEHQFQYMHGEAEEIEEGIINTVRLQQTNKYYGITDEKWQSIQKYDTKGKMTKMYGFYFQRYDYIASHNFRHLFHILDFVKQSETRISSIAANEEERNENSLQFRKYVSFLQAQMSSFELMLLFYNALSFPKMLKLIIEYDFLENLAVENLIHKSHNCIDGIELKSKSNLIK